MIAIDTRGHGKSPRGMKAFTLKQFAEDLKEFLDEKEITKAFILGFSDGGNIALIFSLQYPQYVEKLILNGANLHPNGVKNGIQIPVILGYRMFQFFSIFDKKAIRKKEILGLMVTQPNIKEEETKKIEISTLVIAGKSDMIKQKHTVKIASLIRGSCLCILEGDHFLANKKSREFNVEVEKFLRK